MRIIVEFEYDEEKLGSRWINIDSLKFLLYTENKTRKDLLKINSFQELSKK